LPPATTVPVLSLITTLASISGTTCKVSILAIKNFAEYKKSKWR